MNKKYIVRLTVQERKELENLVRKGKTQAYRIKHANILLAVDADGPNLTDENSAKIFGCHQNTVRYVRQRFVEQCIEAALERKKRENPPREPKIDGEKEAQLIAIACGKPPAGRARWTLKMLAEKLVELEIVDTISDQTVRRVLKKTSLSPTCGNAG
jgi:transposase